MKEGKNLKEASASARSARLTTRRHLFGPLEADALGVLLSKRRC